MLDGRSISGIIEKTKVERLWRTGEKQLLENVRSSTTRIANRVTRLDEISPFGLLFKGPSEFFGLLYLFY
jgi:hypothetical protein